MIAQRDTTVDIMKALGIMLMVWGHAGLPISFAIFNMPLFFVCSGYCFKNSHRLGIKDYLKKKCKALWWPYVKWNCFFILIHTLFYRFHLTAEGYSISEVAFKMFASIVAMEHRESLIGGYWFVKTLLVSSVFAYFVLKRFERQVFAWGGVMLFTAMTLTHFNLEVPLIHIGGKEFTATAFILLGRHLNGRPPKHNTMSVIACIVAVGVVSWFLFPCGSILTVKSWWIPLFFVGAMCGVWVCYTVSKYISQHFKRIERVLAYIGQHTMPILTWHFLSFKIVSYVLIVVVALPIEELASFPTIHCDLGPLTFLPKLMYFATGVFVPVSMCYIFDRFSPRVKILMKDTLQRVRAQLTS